MDPDANLAEQRYLVARMIARTDAYDSNPNIKGAADRTQQYQIAQTHDAERLAELVQALDEWITKGGFLPARWKDGQRDA